MERPASATAGTILARGWDIRYTTTSVTLGANTSVTGDLTASGACTAVSFTSTSDGRFKGDVQPLDAAECLAVTRALAPSSYVRTDLGELATNEPRRVGFVAQQVQESLPSNWSNIIGQGAALTLDYGKLTPILCGAIQALAARVAALEAA